MAKKTTLTSKKKDIKELFGRVTATVIHSRLPVFQATRKVRKIAKEVIKNRWGTVEITGRLGQLHRDLHDVILTYGIEYKRNKGKELYVKIDPAKIRKILGITNPRLLNTLLEDMRVANVTLTAKDEKQQIIAGIISEVERKAVEILGPGGFIQTRYLWEITISRAWMLLFDNYIRIRYENALPIILSIKSGYSQAMARFFLTHKGKMNIKFENCLQALKITREAKLVKRDMKCDLDKLKELGIVIDGDIIHYTQQKNMVNFTNPVIKVKFTKSKPSGK